MKSVVPLIGLILLVMMGNGLIALFGFNYHNLKSSQAQEQLEQAYDGVDRIREIQIHFKRQVQEWKNILLRGHNSDDFAHYAGAFREKQLLVQDKLGSLQAQWDPLQEIAGQVSELNEQLTVLNAHYETALIEFAAGAAAIAIDAQIRGMDRPMEIKLDSMVAIAESKVRQQRQILRKEEQERYKNFRLILSLTTATGCLLALSILVILMRRQAVTES